MQAWNIYCNGKYFGSFEADTLREAANMWAETLDPDYRRVFFDAEKLTFKGFKIESK